MGRPVRRPTVRAVALACVALAALGLGACGGASTAGRSGPRDVRTGPGVTADTITLGALTDLSGPYATMGTSFTNAEQLHVDELNARGGICGRKVRLLVRDHGYDADRAVTQYLELEPQILGLVELQGTPMTTALLPNIESDTLLTVPASWSSTLLRNPYVAVMGTTYDVEAVNAVDHLVRRQGVKAGDVVGHVVVGPALQARFALVSSSAPISTATPAVHDLAAAYRQRFPTSVPDPDVVYGYAAAQAYGQVLQKACDAGDLTRDGVVAAFRATTGVDTGGLLPPLAFATKGAPPALAVYVSRPDAAAVGGLTLVEPLFTSAAAKAYRAPTQA